MTFRIILYIFLSSVFSTGFLESSAQLGKITMDLQKEKPEQFQKRKLRSERTGEKKFTTPTRFIQNTVSHYNYYFNGKEKINAVIEKARLAQQENYRRLLPYYSYSLDNTSAQRTDLDSVIQNATAGILLHDLRSDWVDNFYLLIGQAYYLEKKFDSAYMAFQFINYNLAPKDKKDKSGIPAVVGSNRSRANGTLSVANKEDRNLLQKMFSMPPSRNDALVWQIRTLTDRNMYAEAAGLINTLKNDPNFPLRLQNYLDELQGYWFYRQEMYDSTILYLTRSISNALDKQDQARREYLLAQLYQQKDSLATADNYYALAIKHTTDPLLDIYANLNRTRLHDKDDPDEIRAGIARLLKMSRRDKYHDYRHIIYLAAGDLAMDIPDSAMAVGHYAQSAELNEGDITLKNEALIKRAAISYLLNDYRDAFDAYNNVQPGDTAVKDYESIIEKRQALSKIITQLNIIDREDSLQLVAALPTADREAFLKKLSKKLRKERGLKDEDFEAADFNPFGNKKDGSIDLFSGNTARGEWYFYNQSIKSKGFSEFRREWGNRQNIDNWRRITIRTTPLNPGGNGTVANTGDPMMPILQGNAPEPATEPEQEDVSVEGLRANLPLTEEELTLSNQKIATATYTLGKDYQQSLEDYRAAAGTYETSLQKFPDSLYNGELYMNLSYCYRQLGNNTLASKYQRLLSQNYEGSVFLERLTHPEKFSQNYKDTAGTKMYDDIYSKFIEGNFAEALEEKERADSLYGKNYWSPQLLYIEAVYHIQNRGDSAAIKTLRNLVSEYPNTPMGERAGSLIGVLQKRDSIENYLTNLQVERLPEDSQIVVFDDTRIYGNLPQHLIRNDSNLLPRKITTVDIEAPQLKAEKKIPSPIRNKEFVFDPFTSQNVMMILDKVDPVYSSESRRALERYVKTKFYNRDIKVLKDTLDADQSLIIFSGPVSAEDAIRLMQSLQKDAPREVSWLPADKYKFYIISEDNLELLKENKNLESYILLLREKFPDNF